MVMSMPAVHQEAAYVNDVTFNVTWSCDEKGLYSVQWTSCTNPEGKPTTGINKRGAAVTILTPKVVTNFLSSQTRQSYFMIIEAIIVVHVMYRNGLPHPASTQALQSVWAAGKNHVNKSKQSATIAKHLRKLHSASLPQLMISAYILNVSVSAVECKEPSACALTEEIHHRCSIVQFLRQRHLNEECKVHTLKK